MCMSLKYIHTILTECVYVCMQTITLAEPVSVH